MLKTVEWSIDRSYKSGTDTEPIIFYLDALSNSKSLDLLLGYFSTSAINLLSLGFATFLSKGGRLRLIINHILSKEDRNVILSSHNLEIDSSLIDLTDIKGLKEILDDYGKHFFNCLSWLFANKIFSVKVIKPLNKVGIAHYKSGIFRDDVDSVGFRASCNFTAYGLIENLEEVDTFLSWENSRSSIWINGQQKYFDSIFNEKANFVEYVPLEEIQVAVRNEFGNKDIHELLVDESNLLKKKKEVLSNPKIKAHINKLRKMLDKELLTPKFPFVQGPREYQAEAYSNWISNNKKGIFAMATGTGKTITAINCLLNEFNNCKERLYHALILVPTIVLVKQWHQELLKFNILNIYTISSQSNWRNELTTEIARNKYSPSSFVIVATYDSFGKETFQKILRNLPKDTLLIADEGHHLGRSSIKLKLSDFPLERRIGLSATPKRYYDPEGSEVMEQFFSDSEPYTFTFSMERAIKDNILCQYEYFPQIVTLTEEELVEYNKMSTQIAKLYNMRNENEENSRIEQLLMKRKRIIHKAYNKLKITTHILKELWIKNKSLKYTLVYVPEGKIADSDIFEDNIEDIRLIDLYARSIAEIDPSIIVNQIYSRKQDRDEILKQFANGNIHVITSMKCLDEGIDIPRTETAIFCSSTGNPRQFIQRRGRVLRRHEDKRFATIYDLVVVPDMLNIHNITETYEIERRLVKKELERVIYFASLSNNFFYSVETFSKICNYYNLNIFTIMQELQG